LQFSIYNFQFAIPPLAVWLSGDTMRTMHASSTAARLKSQGHANESGSLRSRLAGFDARVLASFRRRLIAWYQDNARPLPWRDRSDPYAVWVSEIMLQQTTVAAVVPYFNRFLTRFPTVEKLAGAREDEVLRLWEGLGYYSRARNLHKAAREVAGRRGGRFPDDVAELMELPGIGRYTAGAIASFAFNRPAPIVEANSERAFCRLLGFCGDPRSAAGRKLLWEFASRVVKCKAPGLVNQALMELGATVCTSESPECGACPVRKYCEAHNRGWQHEIPLRARRAAPTSVTEIAVAVHRDGRYLLRKRAAGERWAGLWDFARFGWDERDGKTPSAIAGAVRDAYGLDVVVTGRLAEIRHSVTRFRITLCCFLAEWMAGEIDSKLRGARWIAPRQFDRLPLSTTGRKLARLLGERA